MKPECFEPLNMAIGDLYMAHLLLRCSCGQDAALCILMVCVEVDAETPLSAVLPRLKCHACGAPPDYVELTDNRFRVVDGIVTDPTAWSIDLSIAAKRLRRDLQKAA